MPFRGSCPGNWDSYKHAIILVGGLVRALPGHLGPHPSHPNILTDGEPSAVLGAALLLLLLSMGLKLSPHTSERSQAPSPL